MVLLAILGGLGWFVGLYVIFGYAGETGSAIHEIEGLIIVLTGTVAVTGAVLAEGLRRQLKVLVDRLPAVPSSPPRPPTLEPPR